MTTEAEKEFQEWQRQLVIRAAIREAKENYRPPTVETRGPRKLDIFSWACGEMEGFEEEEQEPIYPYMACSRQYELMDPLEGCSVCGGVGLHSSVPNPDWSDPELHHRRWNNVMRKTEGDL